MLRRLCADAARALRVGLQADPREVHSVAYTSTRAVERIAAGGTRRRLKALTLWRYLLRACVDHPVHQRGHVEDRLEPYLPQSPHEYPPHRTRSPVAHSTQSTPQVRRPHRPIPRQSRAATSSRSLLGAIHRRGYALISSPRGRAAILRVPTVRCRSLPCGENGTP